MTPEARSRLGFSPVEPCVRRLVIAIHGHVCVYCGAETKMTVDHLLPRSHGGANDALNLVAACAGCNNARGTLSVDVFLEGMAAARGAELLLAMIDRCNEALAREPACWQKEDERLSALSAKNRESLSTPFEKKRRSKRRSGRPRTRR